jgi:hypothetical protein
MGLTLDTHPAEHTPGIPVRSTSIDHSQERNAYTLRFQIYEDVMIVMNRMRICVRVPAASLKVLPTNKATVYVDV